MRMAKHSRISIPMHPGNMLKLLCCMNIYEDRKGNGFVCCIEESLEGDLNGLRQFSQTRDNDNRLMLAPGNVAQLNDKGSHAF